MRRAAALAVALLAAAVPVARADQLSRSGEAGEANRAQACRFLLGRDDPTCNELDGYDLSEANVAEYEASDTHRRIALQRALDEHAPLSESLLPHTHNSFNSSLYTPSLSRMDHNQKLSITDQLRLDMRAIEIDIHRTVSVTEGRVGVVACHAQAGGGTLVHPGCTNEEPLKTYLVELREWLDANPDELVVLYLENKLDGDPAAHAEASANIEDTIGDLVLRTPGPCAEMPYDSSRADIKLTGARVLIVGNCGPGAWGGWVHDRGSRWDESSDPADNDWSCESERASNLDFDTDIVRRYEDRTWLTAMVGGEGGITVDEMARMVACGVNLVGFDMLHPDDPRLETLVWSWAPSEPAAGTCALQRPDGRWVGAPCGEGHRAACFDGELWTVSTAPVTFAEASSACAFAAPWNGWENGELLDAAGGEPVWVAAATG